jgi:hypothetical protein
LFVYTIKRIASWRWIGKGRNVLSLAAFPDNSTISATRYSSTAAGGQRDIREYRKDGKGQNIPR